MQHFVVGSFHLSYFTLEFPRGFHWMSIVYKLSDSVISELKHSLEKGPQVLYKMLHYYQSK